MEKQEIDEAVMAKYGDSVETSINCVPCSEFHCRHCARNCIDRAEPFETPLEWTPARLCCDRPHSPTNRVIIHEGR